MISFAFYSITTFVIRSLAFSRAPPQLHVITSSFDWLTDFSVFSCDWLE